MRLPKSTGSVQLLKRAAQERLVGVQLTSLFIKAHVYNPYILLALLSCYQYLRRPFINWLQAIEYR